MKSRSSTAVILRKDLLIELRSRESVTAIVLFALSTMVIFHFALQRSLLSGTLAAGVLWVTLLFASVLAIGRLFSAEREQSAFDGMLLAPIDRTALFFAKALALTIYLTALEIVALPVFLIFFIDAWTGTDLWTLFPIMALANLGLATVGTLVSSIAIKSKSPDLLTPLFMLPLMVPIVIAAAGATGPVFAASKAAGGSPKWVLILGLYDTVFLLLAYAVFDYLLEE